jgi:hypothetical protein
LLLDARVHIHNVFDPRTFDKSWNTNSCNKRMHPYHAIHHKAGLQHKGRLPVDIHKEALPCRAVTPAAVTSVQSKAADETAADLQRLLHTPKAMFSTALSLHTSHTGKERSCQTMCMPC